MSWYFNVLKNYATFSGRARRKEYWMFVLFNVIASFILGFIDGITGTISPEFGLGLLSGIYTLAIIIPSLAVTVRRLHDTNRSGGWFFIILIPFVGAIVLFVFSVLDSDSEENQYGPVPALELK